MLTCVTGEDCSTRKNCFCSNCKAFRRPLGLAELTERLDSGAPHSTIIGKQFIGINPPAIADDMGYFILIADWAILIDFDYTILEIIER